MRVLITGVSGFVGVRLAAHLVDCGHEVVGTYWGAAPDLPGLDLEEADIRSLDSVCGLFARTEPDGVIHLGGLSHVGRSWDNIADYYGVNVRGTEHILEAAGGAPLVFASSAEVYGTVPEEEQPISEDREPAPSSPYALTKAAAERLSVAAGAVVVRMFNLVGPGQSPMFALPGFAGQLAEIARGSREPVIEVGNLEARRDFTHIGDGVEGLALLLESGKPGATYNLGTGRAHSIAEALDLLREISGVESTVRFDPERFRPVDLPLLLADSRRLSELGWTPGRTLRQALEQLWTEARGE